MLPPPPPPLPPHIRMYITRKSFVGTFPGPNLTLRHHLVYQGRDDSSVQIVLLLSFLGGPSIKDVGIFWAVFDTPRDFDPDVSNFCLLIICNIGIWHPPPPLKIFWRLLWMAPNRNYRSLTGGLLYNDFAILPTSNHVWMNSFFALIIVEDSRG